MQNVVLLNSIYAESQSKLYMLSVVMLNVVARFSLNGPFAINEEKRFVAMAPGFYQLIQHL